MDFGKVTEKTPLFNEDGDNPVDDENDEEIGMVNLNRDTSTSSVSFNPKGLNKTYIRKLHSVENQVVLRH